MHSHKSQILPASWQDSPPPHQGHQQQQQRPHAPHIVKLSKGREPPNKCRKRPKRAQRPDCLDSNGSATTSRLCDVGEVTLPPQATASSSVSDREYHWGYYQLGIIEPPS